MSYRLTKEEIDEQFEQFLKESVSDDSIEFGTTKRSSILDGLGKRKIKEITNKNHKPWWNSDNDEEDSSGRDILGTGRSFKSQKSSMSIAEEEDEEEQLQVKALNAEDNHASVSIIRDSLEPEESIMASGPHFGFGKDTMDEEEEKEKFFANLEKGASSTIDYSRLNKELDSTNSTVIGTLRNNEEKMAEVTTDKSSNLKPTVTNDFPNHREDFKEGNSHSEEASSPSKEKTCEEDKNSLNPPLAKPRMLAKVSLLDSLESTNGKSRQNTLQEDNEGITESNEKAFTDLDGVGAGVSYIQSGSDLEALQEAYRKINGSFGDSGSEYKIFMGDSKNSKMNILQSLKNTQELGCVGTNTDSDLPTVEELMKPLGNKYGYSRGFELQPASKIELQHDTLDGLSNKESLRKQGRISEEHSDFSFSCEGLVPHQISGIHIATEAISDGRDQKNRVDDSINKNISNTSSIHTYEKRKTSALRINNTNQQKQEKIIRTPQMKGKNVFTGSSSIAKNLESDKKSPLSKQASPVNEKFSSNFATNRRGKHKLPAFQVTRKLKGEVQQTVKDHKMDTKVDPSRQSFTGYLQKQINRSTVDSSQAKDAATKSAQENGEYVPDQLNTVNPINNIQRELSLLQRAEEAQEKLKVEHSLVEKLKAELALKEETLQQIENDLRLEHEKEVSFLKQENYILQAKLHSLEENKKNWDFSDASDPLTKQKLQSIADEAKNQEILIQGYHQENVKLYKQVKELQAANKQNEEKMFKENQRLLTELANIKEQMAQTNKQPIAHDTEKTTEHSFTELVLQLKIAQKTESNMAEEIRRLKQEKQSLEVDLELMKKERNLAKAEVLSTSGDKEFQMKIMEEQYKQEIDGLKKRLQWYAENQELLDKDSQRLKAAATEIEKLNKQVERLKAEAGCQNVQQQKRIKERSIDLKRIQELERQVKEMEEIIRKRHPNSLPALIYAAASATSREVEGADKPNSVAFLERRIKKLEADLEGKDEDAKKSLRAMEQQFQKMKIQYEQTILDLEKQLKSGQDTPKRYSSNHNLLQEDIQLTDLPDSKEDILQAENNVHNQHLTNQQMTTCHRAVKNLQKAEGHAINDFNSIDIERLQQELAMKNTKIQELAKTVEVLQKERRTLLSNQTKVEKIWEKKTKPSKADRINTESSSTQYLENPEPFPATLDEKCYQPNVFAGLHISDVLQENEKLKLEIEQLILETEKQKVTLQAAVTEAECEAKRSQIDAAEHISCLKVAHQKELERIITQHALEHSSSKVAELTNKVSTQEIMIHFLQNQVADLQRSKEDLAASKVHGEKLQKQVAVLEEELEEAKQKYSPELKHFLALERKIKNMELRHAQREQELQKVIQQTHCTVDSKLIQENEKWKRLAQNKSNELEMFRIELDSILDVLRELQKQGVVIPEPSVVGTFSSKVTGNI
ncbi:centrosomal protein of 162 kDa [Erpetoichthys calabaricus]|nr:centrosomal protein of 162 kDa [Erpetoichthys calabaricus]XP_051781306.1 centrosomal protein of 162 kDa [Erpetoichthys calabaricus]